MYMAVLVSSISAFVCSFVPVFGVVFVVIFSMISIIFSILMLNKNKNIEKEPIIISLIISVVSILICIIVNAISASYVLNNLKDEQENIISYYEEKFENYNEYTIKDKVVATDKFKMYINNITHDGNNYYIDVIIESLIDGEYFSIYNFGIYDAQKNDFWFAKTSSLDEYVSGQLNVGQTKEFNLKVSTDTLEENEKYFVYIDEENGIKIKI